MIKLTLKRTDARSDGIFGEMYFNTDIVPFCVTLEHAFSDGAGGFKPIIPPGTYTCRRRLSPKFGYDVFELLNVAGHDFIEIHVGNFNRDSDGCVILGRSIAFMGGAQMITYSKATFESFMAKLADVSSFPLTVV